MKNPLLSYNPLPSFINLLPKHAEPAVSDLVTNSKEAVKQLAAQKNPTWENLMQPLEAISNRFDRIFSPVSHMNSVNNTQEWRDAYNRCLELVTDYGAWVGQYRPLFDAISALQRDSVWSALNAQQKKIITYALRDFTLSGVSLEPTARETFTQLTHKLSKLSTRFEENLLDATQAWHYHVTDQIQLSGLPEHAIEQAASVAKEHKLSGWVLTLDAPCYMVVMQYADDDHLREQMYQAYVTRASDQGPHDKVFDNSQVMVELLKAKYEKAKLLQYDSYADFSLETKMAKDSHQVLSFLEDLAEKSLSTAKAELTELQQFAKKHYAKETLHAWDMAYYSEKLLQHSYAISQEVLRPYFPESKVLQGMFAVVEKLYGISIEAIPTQDVWHPTVKLFAIKSANQDVIAYFYIDLYARSKKRSGAWMDDYCGRYRLPDGQLQLPVAFLTCNFAPPIADKPALLTHDDVITLFHEFGHGLHHMLTQVDYLAISGINQVAWDAVELPSQLMENFCWEADVLPWISAHFETHEPLPQRLFQNLLRAKNFHSGLSMLRQLEFALFDFKLHMQKPENSIQIQQVLDKVRASVSVLNPPAYHRFQHSFSHIFAGGYAAGYYSYKWAEVLSSDVYESFQVAGVLSPEIGQRFLECVLGKGGSEDALDLFVAFKQREPQVDALLRSCGIQVTPS